jgi:hypothetical protein
LSNIFKGYFIACIEGFKQRTLSVFLIRLFIHIFKTKTIACVSRVVFVVVDLEVADVALGLGLFSLSIEAYPYLVTFFFGHPPEIFNHYFTA